MNLLPKRAHAGWCMLARCGDDQFVELYRRAAAALSWHLGTHDERTRLGCLLPEGAAVHGDAWVNPTAPDLGPVVDTLPGSPRANDQSLDMRLENSFSPVSHGAASLRVARFETVSSSDRLRSEAPTSPEIALVPCPACANEHGEPMGEHLVQLPSGTWVRRTCESCQGLRRLDREALARYRTLAAD
jgi:hypothetical protein